MPNATPRLILAASLLAGCQSGHSAPEWSKASSRIVGGTADGGHPAVGVIIFSDAANPSNGFLCTGTLIADNVMLTAGHCTVVDDTCTPPNCSANPASGYTVYGGENPVNTSTWAPTNPDWQASVASVNPNPNYDGSSLEGDEGVLVLTGMKAVGGSVPTPMAWNSSDSSVYSTGTTFTAVGFGITSGSGQTAGAKASVSLTIESDNQGEDATEMFQYGSSSKNTCSGDSGGPAIANMGGVDTVIGTTSFGDQNCSTFGVDQRTDANASFINGVIAGAASNPTPTPSGTASPTPTPSGTPVATPNPSPSSTPSGNGANGGNKVGGCDVAGGVGTDPATLLALIIPAGLALLRRRRRA